MAKAAESAVGNEIFTGGGWLIWEYNLSAGETIAFRYMASGGEEFHYWLSGDNGYRKVEYIRAEETMSDYETVVFPELPAGKYRLEVIYNAVQIDMSSTEASYDAYVNVDDAAGQSYTITDYRSGEKYQLAVTLDGKTLKKEYTLPQKLDIAGVLEENSVYDGQLHPGYTGAPSAEGYTGEIKLSYQQKTDIGYTALTETPKAAGQYRAIFSIDPINGTYCGVCAVEFSVEKATVTLPTVPGKIYNGENQRADIPQNEAWTVINNEGGKGAGLYDVVLKLTDPSNYKWANSESEELTLKLTIEPKPITVTADAKSKKAGEPDPALTYTAEGLISGDILTGGLERTPGETVGEYGILLGTVDNPNYTITYIGAMLAIEKIPDETTEETGGSVDTDSENQNSTSSTEKEAGNANTGDQSFIYLWKILLLISAAAMGLLAAVRKKISI